MIKATDFISKEAKQAAETEALGAVLDVFAKEIGGKIFIKLEKGYFGWDDPANLNEIRKRLLTNFEKGDMVDVAALAMFIWNLQNK
jgi:argininosuccinate synthase